MVIITVCYVGKETGLAIFNNESTLLLKIGNSLPFCPPSFLSQNPPRSRAPVERKKVGDSLSKNSLE